MTQTEQEIITKLHTMLEDGRYISLQLWPHPNESRIKAQNNVMKINEGRDGKWEGVSEEFYDAMVDLYDSSCSKFKNK